MGGLTHRFLLYFIGHHPIWGRCPAYFKTAIAHQGRAKVLLSIHCLRATEVAKKSEKRLREI